MVQRVASIILVLTTASVGSGLLSHLHDLAHAAEDAARAQARARQGLPPEPHPHHDQTNCHLHAQLRVPLFSPLQTVLVPAPERVVGAVLPLPNPPAPPRVPLHVVCRRPPR